MIVATSTNVVNLHRDPYDVYIGRSSAKQPHSKWGNPYQVGKIFTSQLAQTIQQHPNAANHCIGDTIDRTAAIALYRIYLEIRIESRQLSARDFIAIYGKTLGCFCKPLPCHGDIIALFCHWFRQRPESDTGPPEDWTP